VLFTAVVFSLVLTVLLTFEGAVVLSSLALTTSSVASLTALAMSAKNKDLVLKGSDEMSSFMEKRKGLLCTFAIAVVSVMLDKLFPVIGSAVFAIILGMVLNQFWKIPSDFR